MSATLYSQGPLPVSSTTMVGCTSFDAHVPSFPLIFFPNAWAFLAAVAAAVRSFFHRVPAIFVTSTLPPPILGKMEAVAFAYKRPFQFLSAEHRFLIVKSLRDTFMDSSSKEMCQIWAPHQCDSAKHGPPMFFSAIVCLSVSSVNIKNAQFRTSLKIYVRNAATFFSPIDWYDANCHWPKFQENPRNEHGI